MNYNELQIIWLTLRVSILSVLITIPISVWLGWILARKNIAAKPLVETLISLPLVAPPVVTGYLLLLLLGSNGFLGKWLNEVFGIHIAFNFAALVVASVVVSLPLAVRSIRSSFEQINPAYEQASMSMGASRFSTFIRVSLPMALPGVLSGAALAFARSLGEFGATITLAGNIPGKTQTISLIIYSNMQTPGKGNQVAALVGVSLLISFGALALSEIINKRNAFVSP